MKRCTYCGKEHSDAATVCSVDQQPLEFVASPLVPGVPIACNHDINDEAAAQRNDLKQKLSAIAKVARAKGASYGEIETELIERGIDKELIIEVMLEVQGKTPQGRAEKNDLAMRHGFLWLVGGLFVTIATFMMAGSSPRGGIYIIAWGPVIGGGIQFMRAWSRSNR